MIKLKAGSDIWIKHLILRGEAVSNLMCRQEKCERSLRKQVFLSPRRFICSPGAKVESIAISKTLILGLDITLTHAYYICTGNLIVMPHILPTFHNRSLQDFSINSRNRFMDLNIHTY